MHQPKKEQHIYRCHISLQMPTNIAWDDVKHLCNASKLLALSWIWHPNCCRILFTELYKHCKAAFTVFHQINDNRDNNLSWNLNEQMKKITYIHDIFYFLQSIFFRTKLEKKNNLAWFMVDLGSHLACSTLQLKSKWWAVRNHLRERHRIASWWHCAKL